MKYKKINYVLFSSEIITSISLNVKNKLISLFYRLIILIL